MRNKKRMIHFSLLVSSYKAKVDSNVVDLVNGCPAKVNRHGMFSGKLQIGVSEGRFMPIKES